MFSLFLLWIGALTRLFRSRGNLVLENLVLRQQLVVLKRRHPRPSLAFFDKLFWVVVRQNSARGESHPCNACYTASLYVIDLMCS
jgi:hypothetical protein